MIVRIELFPNSGYRNKSMSMTEKSTDIMLHDQV